MPADVFYYYFFFTFFKIYPKDPVMYTDKDVCAVDPLSAFGW